jgi:hypothetical protein
MKKLIWAALALSVLVAPVFAANEGTAVGVNPEASVRINTTNRVLIAGDGISVGETLLTGPQGQVQIIFADDTHLVVGPNSSLLIETYLMRNDGTAEKLAVNALAGSFRFITGHSPKSAYQIKTPTAAIAVRGTAFDIIVGPTDTRVMLYNGALQLCGPGGDCAQLNARCEVGTASAGLTQIFTQADPERPPLAFAFLYARFPTLLLGEFRVAGAGQCLQNAAQEQPESLSGFSSSSDGQNTAPGGTPGTGGQPGVPGVQGPSGQTGAHI